MLAMKIKGSQMTLLLKKLHLLHCPILYMYPLYQYSPS